MAIQINGNDYENFVQDEDGESPFRVAVEQYLRQAAEDKCRLRIDVRSQAAGIKQSRPEHQWETDPAQVTPEAIVNIVRQKLGESPGEGFSGQIRINFSQAGSTGNRYGSYTRQVQPDYGEVEEDGGYGARGRRGREEEGDEGGDGGEEGGDEEGSENGAGEIDQMPLTDVPPHHFPRGRTGSRMGGGMGMMPPTGGGIYMDEASVKSWLTTIWGLNFRQQASMLAMFERSTRMMEAMAMRWGIPDHPISPGITDVAHNPATETPSGIAMLLPLINAAAKIASASNAGEAVQSAANMASGQAPPADAGRALAVKGASRMMQNLRKPPKPPEPPLAPAGGGGGPEDGGGDDGGGDEGLTYADDEEELEEEGDGGEDFTDLPPDDVFKKLEEWIAKDPENRKGEILKNSGRLMKLMQ